MKKLFHIILLSLVLLVSPSFSEAQTMDNYCQIPSSISAPVPPNVMFLIDTSGSMSWCAYTGDSCSTVAYPYSATTTYEGYFDPEKYYAPDGSGVYVEVTPTGLPCVKTCVDWKCYNWPFGAECDYTPGTHSCSSKKYACCQSYTQSGDCGVETGNYLNYLHMRRIDVLRWALTGGKPDSCDNETDTKCNPDLYLDPKPDQLSCDATGCILRAYDGTKVKARYDRIDGVNGGLLYQLKFDLETKPYIGAMFFNNNGIVKTVYIGDFTASNEIDTMSPFKNVITSVNYQPVGGSTPTGPVMWDALNYYAQNDSRYGGPAPQTGLGSEWKNPMNRCFDTNLSGDCQGSEYQFVPCSKNFVILMTDGQWNRGGYPVNSYCKIDGDTIETESPDPVVAAYKMHKIGFTNVAAIPPTTSYVESVYTVGLWLGGTGEQSLKNVAMYGSFNRSNTWPGGTSGYPLDTCSPVNDCCNTADCGKGSPCTALPASSPDWDSNGDGIPDTFFKADDAAGIKAKIAEIILEIMRRVSSGSAVSILSSSEGTGANLLQAVYYPRKAFGATEIEWIGEMQNLWYYVDPYLASSTIREDTNIVDGADGKNILNLSDDYVLELYFDPLDGKTKAKRYSTDNEGGSKTYIDTVQLDDIKNLYEIGSVLFNRTSSRTVYTTTDESTFIDFSTANKSTLRDYLQAADDTESEKIIDYVHGIDQAGYRSRTVTIDGTTAVWKLGDIVNSSPRMQSSVPLNSYYKSPPDGYSDTTYRAYIDSSMYKERGMSYIGANDGMLHAFKHGILEQVWSTPSPQQSDEKARLRNPDGTTPLGTEIWTYIPKNTLPYLKYLADPDYCHLFSVDGSAIMFDASIENVDTTNGTTPDDYSNDTKTQASWKTVLIGGMGLGGASKITGHSCTTGASGTCVKTPRTDPADATKGLGYSSYFAIDITNPDSPSLLWEFSNPNLGFSTSGPAVVRIGDASKNGKWFAVFASGPTGPLDTIERQFLGKSDQNLRLFILDLKTGNLLRTIDTGIAEAFGGSLYNGTIDTDKGDITSGGRYKDDAIYLGYTKKDSTTWTKGGVIRILTRESDNPADWVWSHVIENIGPVTSAVTKLQDRNKKNLWLYFGSGRFFYRLQSGVDDVNGLRSIYGVREPCYNDTTGLPPGPVNDINPNCTKTVTTGLEDQSEDAPDATLPTGSTGWYINLAATSGNDGAERVITDPYAVSSGAVFFTTYTPSTDVCAEGGSTAIWAVKYDTGGVVYLSGMALTQVSTGAIHELPLKTVFTQRGNRRTALMTGMPPKGQGLSILIGPKPIRKILHMKEK